MLNIIGIHQAYDGRAVLKGVDLTVEKGEILCLLGPSGCGKTTLLRIIAGLEHPDSGDIRLHQRSLLNVPVQQRQFGFMFQDFALFPHLTAGQNIAFGLNHLHKEQRQQRVQDMLRLVKLDSFEKRDVTLLSGGERQRVALARSLAPDPSLLMLDEPLGSLDYTLRENLYTELRSVIKAMGLTSIYVTHDHQEAFAVADRIALMNAGVIEQIATPEQLYLQPATRFSAQFLGLENIVPVVSFQDGIAETPVGRFSVLQPCESLLLHPVGISLIGDNQNCIRGEIIERRFQGSRYHFRLRHTSGITLRFEIPAQDSSLPQQGDIIDIYIAPDRIIPLVETIR